MSVTNPANIVAAAGPGLAALAGVSKRTASRWLDGQARVPASALLLLARRSVAVREALLATLGLDDAACLARLAEIEAAIGAARARRLARTAYDPENPPHALAPGAARRPSVDQGDAGA